ncbi:hypothetical protein APICC_05754 [Apis cerana cerana]|uniref:Uncharacterized protein n=1 Tax=Apis cerana cerana TaxID=94128 RepID=A0A2A3EIU2_APICC|nr:hypothetical protein APICC_05754 [Apis cerana cerana]
MPPCWSGVTGLFGINEVSMNRVDEDSRHSDLKMETAVSTIDQEQDRQHGVYFTRAAQFQVATQVYVGYLGKLARGPVFTRWIHLRDSYRIFVEYLTLEVVSSVAGCRILLARSISLKIGQFTFYEELSYNPRCTNRDIIVQIHPTVKLGLVRPVIILWINPYKRQTPRGKTRRHSLKVEKLRINFFYQNKDVVSTRKGRNKKEKTMYTCSGCKYESPRQYNVQRHNERIHLRQKLNICCGETFFTKGDYYVHCELCHPESRTHAITSRTKYKIVNNDVLPADQHCSKWPRQIMGKSYNMRLRSSNSIRKNDRVEELRTKVSYEYSVSCREFDIENIPLISFITDPRLKSQWLERLSTASSAIDKAEPEKGEAGEETVKIEISSEQNIEKTVSTNEEENVKRTKVSDSTVSSFSLELPAKKLILHRFRSSVREFEIPLREQNGGVNRSLRRPSWRMTKDNFVEKLRISPEKMTNDNVFKKVFIFIPKRMNKISTEMDRNIILYDIIINNEKQKNQNQIVLIKIDS